MFLSKYHTDRQLFPVTFDAAKQMKWTPVVVVVGPLRSEECPNEWDPTKSDEIGVEDETHNLSRDAVRWMTAEGIPGEKERRSSQDARI